MPDRIRLNEDHGVIEVQSYGQVSKKDIAESISKVREVLSSKGISKILVDTTKQETMPSTTDIYMLFSDFPREFRLALLMPLLKAQILNMQQKLMKSLSMIRVSCLRMETVGKQN